MHECLQIPELLEKICGETMDYTDLDNSSLSLVRLAQTCKLFTEPALNELYFEIRGVDRLFMLFPRGVWRMNDTGPGAFGFTRTLKLSDWEIFNANSHRVKRMLQAKDSVKIHRAAFEAVCLPPHLPILPNLRAFFWSDSQSYLPGYFIRCLCGPNISTLGMRAIPSKVFPLVSAISISCSGLRKLYVQVQHNTDAEDFRHVLMESLPHMSNLQLLDLNVALDCSLLRLMSKLSLQDLTIRSFEVSSHTHEQCLNQKNHWATLRSLRLFNSTFSNIPVLLGHVGYMPNVSIVKYLGVKGRRKHLEAVFDATNRHFNPSELSVFSLQEDPGNQNEGLDTTFNKTIETFRFSSLASVVTGWVNLEKFLIRMYLVSSMSDDNISMLAISFPKLRVLQIDGLVGTCRLVSFNGLHTLLEKCPMLETIHLAINATTHYKASRSTSPRNNRITSIHLDFSPLEDPIYVASILCYFFPRLRRVQTSWPGTQTEEAEKYTETWKQVNLLISGFHARDAYEKLWSKVKDGDSAAMTWLPSGNSETSADVKANFTDEYMNDGVAFWSLA